MLTLGVFAVVGGCSTSQQSQLEQAAKDWCETIRASQIMPVYPLTEDVQPGDIFLVQLPIDQQQRLFNEKGYLPLDNHLGRINPTGYLRFYDHSFLAPGASIVLPAQWIRPGHYLTNSWVDAPNAAFPTYSFSVRRGMGINLAVPVEGVPVGLSLLGTDAADGTVIIKNAHTLGVDTVSLYQDLKRWADTNSDFLACFGSSGRNNYLRIVSRIYTVGYVDISLRDASSRAGGVDAGAAKPVDLLTPELMNGTNANGATAQSNFVAGNNLLQQMMTNALAAKDAAGNLLPGGSLRLTAASRRTISLRESFEPPLTLGYLGFDCPIMPGGELGPPIPTYSILSTNFNVRPIVEPRTQRLLDFAVYKIIREQAAVDHRARSLMNQLDGLISFVPANFIVYETDNSSKTNFVLVANRMNAGVMHNPKKAGFELFLGYKDMVDLSTVNLQNALALSEFTLNDRTQKSGQRITADSTACLLLSEQLDYYRNVFELIARDPVYQKAMSAAYTYERDRL